MDKFEKLIDDLSSADSLTRINAAYDLGELKDKRAVESLINVLKENDKQMRYAAAEALGKIADKRARGALTEALNDSDSAVVRAADKSLHALGTTGGSITTESIVADNQPQAAAPSDDFYRDTTRPQKAIIVDFDMPFWSLVMFMVKFAIASIPATIILFITFAVLWLILGGVFVALVSRR